MRELPLFLRHRAIRNSATAHLKSSASAIFETSMEGAYESSFRLAATATFSVSVECGRMRHNCFEQKHFLEG